MAEGDTRVSLVSIHQCFAFDLPQKTPKKGYRADDWSEEPSWSGKLVVVATDADNANIELRDPATDTLFVQATITRNDSTSVQKVMDSSRYFVLTTGGAKNMKKVGIAFENRSDAFDFNSALENFHQAKEKKESLETTSPSKDYSLKTGQTMKLRINTVRTPKHSAMKDPFSPGSSKPFMTDTPTSASATAFEQDASHSFSDWETF